MKITGRAKSRKSWRFRTRRKASPYSAGYKAILHIRPIFAPALYPICTVYPSKLMPNANLESKRQGHVMHDIRGRIIVAFRREAEVVI